MRVLINATAVPKVKAGIGVYGKNLLDHLTQIKDPLEIFILAQDDDRELDFSDRGNVTMIWVPASIFRRLPFRFLLEQLYLPLMLRLRGIAVVHSLHYALPLISLGTKRVVTFHDASFITMPEVHERLKVIYFRWFMRASTRLAEHIIFVSQSALNDCEQKLGTPHGGRTVVPHGKGDAFRPDVSAARIEQVRQKYLLQERFILYVGTIEPRKNLSRLLEAFAQVAAFDSDIQLVIAGKVGWLTEGLFQTLEALQISSRVVFTGFVSEEDKPALLAACTIFVYPSLYEGFGLPALEALACGAPTITSNTSSLPEVVGDAAVLVDPTSTDELAAAIRELLSNSVHLAELKEKGPRHAAAYTWQRTAEMTASVYQLAQSDRSHGES